MLSKGIIVVALLQIGALIYGILFTAALLKPGVQLFESHPDWGAPLVFREAVIFRNYGLVLSLVIVAWMVFAGYHSSSLSGRNIDDRYIIGSGIALLVLIFGMGTYFAIMATCPFWSW